MMKKIYIQNLIIPFVLGSILIATNGCKKFNEANDNTKVAYAATPDALFASGTKNLSDLITSTNQNFNPFRLWVQHWTETTYTDEANYNIVSRSIPDRWFSGLYINVLQNYQSAIAIENTTNPTGDPAQQANRLAILDMMSMYTYSILVDLFGDVPYNDANKIGTTLLPKYDKQADIYDTIITHLYNDIKVLNVKPKAGNFGTSDLVYGGNTDAWIKFANSFLLRMGMMLVDASAATKYTAIQLVGDALNTTNGGVFTSNADDALFQYLGGTPNTNPLYVDLVLSGRIDYVACQTLIDALKNDNRTQIFFQPLGGSGTNYVGGIAGSKTSASNVSLTGLAIIKPTLPAVFFSYAEVQFLLAEAITRGNLGVTGNANDYYKAGIKANVDYWIAHQNGTSLAAGDFSNITNLTLPGNKDANMQAIAQQLWIALYNQGFEGWTQWRRLDYPSLPVATSAYTESLNANDQAVIPKRFTYPVTEYGTNGNNVDAASKNIGGDKLYTMLFWDKYNNQWGSNNQKPLISNP